jgi:hypothetical protein
VDTIIFFYLSSITFKKKGGEYWTILENIGEIINIEMINRALLQGEK